MRTFAQKPKLTRQATSAKPMIPARTHFGQSHEVSSILHLQRMIGNHAVQRLLEVNSGEVEGYNPSTEIARFGHDFSRISVYPDDRAEIAAQENGAGSNTVGRSIGFGCSEAVATDAWRNEVIENDPIPTM